MMVRFVVVVIPDLETSMTGSWHTVFIEVSCVVEVQLDAFIRQACHVAGTRFSSRSATELQCRKGSWNKHDIRFLHIRLLSGLDLHLVRSF